MVRVVMGAGAVETGLAPPPGDDDRGILKFLTCGSVDDGKSTLIGRLLFESQAIYDDQLAAVAQVTRQQGSTGDEVDLALLLDGLEIERQQGITIDVAYRYFATPVRSFIVADTPGHEQYTRNMATGASNSDLAVILVDARKGVLTQTRRHSFICGLLGIRDVVLAVNKMDLVDFQEQIFNVIVSDFEDFAKDRQFRSITCIPISARYGDNIVGRSARMPWFSGQPLLAVLESADGAADQRDAAFRLPIQRVNRPNSEFRGFSGTIASGAIRVGDDVISAVTGKSSKVSAIVTADGNLEQSIAGDAITVVLADEIDVARGDVLCHPKSRPDVADQFAANVLWMSEQEMLPGRSYQMRIGTQWMPASITSIKYAIDVNSGQHLAARTLALNDLAVCNIATTSPVAFDSYSDNRQTGSFILVNRTTNETVGAGMIQFGLRRASNIHVESLIVDKDARATAKGQRQVILWFTGLSGSGKSTIAKLLEKRLHDVGKHTYVLDGDNVRHGINRDLGFTDADRVENIRRIGEVAKLFADAGLIVICSFISPFRAERKLVRDLVAEDEFVEVFVDASVEECARRDPKGLYAKARRGEILNFTGIDSAYEPPQSPEVHLQTERQDQSVLVERILTFLQDTGRL